MARAWKDKPNRWKLSPYVDKTIDDVLETWVTHHQDREKKMLGLHLKDLANIDVKKEIEIRNSGVYNPHKAHWREHYRDRFSNPYAGDFDSDSVLKMSALAPY